MHESPVVELIDLSLPKPPDDSIDLLVPPYEAPPTSMDKLLLVNVEINGRTRQLKVRPKDDP